MQTRTRKSNIKFYLLVSIFVVPMIIGWVLFHYHSYFVFKTTNHGTLLTPPVSIENIVLNSGAEKKWQIVFLAKDCEETETENMMHTLHQIQKALGKNSDRSSLILGTQKLCNADYSSYFHKLSVEQYGALKSLLQTKNLQTSDSIYLVDPIGNVFMYYSVASDPMFILKDLNHVLEVSQIG